MLQFYNRICEILNDQSIVKKSDPLDSPKKSVHAKTAMHTRKTTQFESPKEKVSHLKRPVAANVRGWHVAAHSTMCPIISSSAYVE